MKCRLLLEENADIAQRRRDLEDELVRLGKFAERLQKLAEDAGFVEPAGRDVHDDVDLNEHHGLFLDDDVMSGVTAA